MESAILEESAYYICIGQLINKRMLTNVPITGEYNLFQAWSNMAYMSGVGTRDKWWEWCSITDTAAAGGADNCSAQLS